MSPAQVLIARLDAMSRRLAPDDGDELTPERRALETVGMTVEADLPG